MSEVTSEQHTDDDLRRHAETAAEGPVDTAEPDDESDQLRQHAETPPEG